MREVSVATDCADREDVGHRSNVTLRGTGRTDVGDASHRIGVICQLDSLGPGRNSPNREDWTIRIFALT